MVPIPASLRIQNPAATTAALTNIQPELLPPGCIALVVAQHEMYEWRNTSVVPADGDLVVANAKGASHPGRWHKITGIPLPPGTSDGETVVWDAGASTWIPISASAKGIDLQAKPLSNFRDYRGDVTIIAAGAGDVALNLNSADAGLPLADVLSADTSRPIGMRVQWWQDASPLVEQWTDDLVVTHYRSTSDLVILSDLAGGSASGAGSASLGMTGTSGAMYELTSNTVTGLVTLSMAQDATDDRRAVVTTWLADAVPITTT
jgi:hypothetical protein